MLFRGAGSVIWWDLVLDLSIQLLSTGDFFHGVFSRASCRRDGVKCLYALLYLLTCVEGRWKVTACWPVLDA